MTEEKKYALGEILLRAENVGLCYGEKCILKDINFEIRNVTRIGMAQGQVVALIGRSGMGKSQLFNLLSGLNRPTTGKILICEDQHEVTPGEVGIIPQNYILFNHRTVLQNLRIGAKNSGRKTTKAQEDELIKKYAEDFGLTDHLQKYPAQLSGGQKQRVSIIQQVLTDNKFILLDEPFSGLDAIMIDKVITLLNKVSTLNELNTLVIVSHDIESAMAIADTAWVLARKEGVDGATITHQHDLKAMGMAWDPDIRKRADFQEFVHEVKTQI